MSARLLDESAGGFAVLVHHPPALSVGQPAQLHTDSGWFEVRIVNVREAAPPEGGSEADPTGPEPWFRVGLLRLGEATLADTSRMRLIAESLYFRFSKRCSTNGTMITVGILLALAIALLPLAWQSLSFRADHPKAQRTANDAELDLPVLASSDHPLLKLPFPLGPSDGRQSGSKAADPAETSPEAPDTGQSASGSRRDTDQLPKLSVPMSAQDLQTMIRRLAGAEAMTLSEVAQRLRLSERQKWQIRRIVNDTADYMRKLTLDTAPQGRKSHKFIERCEALLSDSRRQALELLTPQRRTMGQNAERRTNRKNAAAT